ncbi:MAG: type II toxin-antitoxin system VapC family toxin [Gemmatimonadetes bacterium]|nr:type II toxin-antitoxin system VapC family toxin [Gemmatimonadota bacterium]
MMKFLLDTNVLLRFLRDDHPNHSPAAQSLFSDASDGKCVLVLTEVAVAEAVWVLESFFRTRRTDIAEGLSKVITCAGVRCMRQFEMIDALNRYAYTNCDFLDCYLAALAAASGDHVATFDRDFDRFDDVKRWQFSG